MNWLIEIVFMLIMTVFAYAMLFCYEKDKRFINIPIEEMTNGWREYFFLFAAELFVGIIVLVFAYIHSYTVLSVLNVLCLAQLLLPVAYIDYRNKLIPNQMLICMLIVKVILLAFELFFQETDLVNYMISSGISILVFCGVFFLISLVFKNSIGMGDVKLFGVLSIYLGLYGTLHVLFYALIITFFYACFLLITKKKDKKDEISFAPMVALGMLACVILGLL